MHHHRDRQSPGRTTPSEPSQGRDHRSTRQTISGSTGYHQVSQSRRSPEALDPTCRATHQVSQSRRSPEALDPTCRATPVPGEPAQPTGGAIPGQESPAKTESCQVRNTLNRGAHQSPIPPTPDPGSCQVRNTLNRGAHQSPIPPTPDPGKTYQPPSPSPRPTSITEPTSGTSWAPD
ncbi:hypothetical protein QE152_g31265 [Popillia japonica]|uniref:Uncharacterized protein n=1 Tax=Popillia japonica TaxID=7064 RepID=A0AAW1JAH2_POPJA